MTEEAEAEDIMVAGGEGQENWRQGRLEIQRRPVRNVEMCVMKSLLMLSAKLNHYLDS